MKTITIAIIATMLIVAWGELIIFSINHIPVVQSYRYKGEQK